MEKVKIAFVDELSFDIESKMEKGLEEYEESHGIDVNYKPFSLVLYDEKNEVIGAMAAFSSYLRIPIGTNGLSFLKSNTNSGFTRTLIPIIAEQLA